MERNYAIDTLRTIATLLVILLHVSSNYVLEQDYARNYHFTFWVANVVDSFTRICVPLFVLISGMFLVGRKESLRESYKKRASRIIIPLFAWTVIYLIFSALFQYIGHHTIDYNGLLSSVILGRPYYHLWYLYMLIGLYLIVPILNYSIIFISRKTLWIIAISLLLFGIINYSYSFYYKSEMFFLLWFINYLGYFILGYLLKNSNKVISLTILLGIYIITSLLIAAFSYCTMRYFNNSFFYGNLTPFVILGSVCIYKIFQQINLKQNFLSKISYLTLGIYLIHAGVLVTFDSGLKIMGIDFFSNPAYGIPVKFCVVFAVSYLVAYLFSRIYYLRRII